MKRWTLWVIVLLSINQILVLIRNLQLSFTPVLTILYILGWACDVFLIIIILRQEEKERIKRELEAARRQAEMEKLYYEEMDKEREAMAKIRHDYNNLIASILGLIHIGREAEAETVLDELIEKMENN